MKQRPTSTFGLVKHVIQLRWEKMGSRGRKVLTIGALVLAFGALATATSCMLRGCLLGGCPYSQQAVAPVAHPALEANTETGAIDYDGCPHAARAEAEAAQTEPVGELTDPAEVVRACRYNQTCIIAELEGRTDSARTLGILSEAYRANGLEAEHLETVETLRRLYPESTAARMYR